MVVVFVVVVVVLVVDVVVSRGIAVGSFAEATAHHHRHQHLHHQYRPRRHPDGGRSRFGFAGLPLQSLQGQFIVLLSVGSISGSARPRDPKQALIQRSHTAGDESPDLACSVLGTGLQFRAGAALQTSGWQGTLQQQQRTSYADSGSFCTGTSVSLGPEAG